MSIEPALEACFKPEDRKRGADIYAKDQVFVASAADTSVKAMIKASGSPRVTLACEDVTDALVRATCTCPPSNKGQTCKHLWAVLLALDERDADFLTGKTDVELIAREAKPDPRKAYQKERYEQQKARAKEMRREQKAAAKAGGGTGAGRPGRTGPVEVDRSIYPEPVREALAYFLENGFDLAVDLELPAVLDAKRTLARIFHPDKGGTHEEAVTLNENFDVLREYLGS